PLIFAHAAEAMSIPSDLLEQFALHETHFSRDELLRFLHFPFFLFLLSLTAICISCGSVVSGPSPPVTASVMVTPGSTQTFTGSKVQFSAVVQNASTTTVNWRVNQLPGGNLAIGTLD